MCASKKEEQEKVYIREGVFPFMKLSPELRNRIYELAVHVPNAGIEIQPIGEYKCSFIGQGMPIGFFDDVPTDFPTYDAFRVNKGPGLTCYKEGSKPTPVPGLLMVSKQIRKEALPVFYNLSVFVIYDCPASKVVEWLRDVVFKQEQQKHLGCIIWQGPFYKDNCKAGWLFAALEKASRLPRLTTNLMIYRKAHVECAIEEALEEMGKLGLAEWTGRELTEGLRTGFEDWWALSGG